LAPGFFPLLPLLLSSRPPHGPLLLNSPHLVHIDSCWFITIVIEEPCPTDFDPFPLFRFLALFFCQEIGSSHSILGFFFPLKNYPRLRFPLFDFPGVPLSPATFSLRTGVRRE